MAKLHLIKRRIKSIANIAQITKGMEMLSASKMRKAQRQAEAGKLYAQKILEAVGKVCQRVDPKLHPLLKSQKGKTLVILISTNRGLCGGLNTNLFTKLSHWFPLEEETTFVTLGKKGQDFVLRTKRKLLADFSFRYPFSQSVPALASLATKGFLKGEYGKVFLVFSQFVSFLSQRPKKKLILPLRELELKSEENSRQEFLIEPSWASVLNSLLPHFIETQIRSSILEAEACEHASRMMAMRNATENALSLMADLTLEYNRARQEAITYEIADGVRTRIAIE